jgi:hypothetical protein
MEPLAIAHGALGAVEAAKMLLEFAHSFSQRTTIKFAEARDDLFRDWVAELALALRAQAIQAADIEARTQDLHARLKDPVYRRAVDILEDEAAHEPTLTRRRMLAFAAAGWSNLQLGPAQLSRVLRVVRELNPEDVELLHSLATHGDQEVPQEVFESSPEGAARHDILIDNQPSGDILVASTCVRVRYTTGLNNLGPEAHVTIVGRWVLQSLDPFVRAVEADQTFLERPIEQLASSLPDGHPDRERLLGYQGLADLATQLRQGQASGEAPTR